MPLFKELDRQLDALAMTLWALEGLQLLENVGFDLLIENMVNVPYLRVVNQAEIEIGELGHGFDHQTTDVAGGLEILPEVRFNQDSWLALMIPEDDITGLHSPPEGGH